MRSSVPRYASTTRRVVRDLLRRSARDHPSGLERDQLVGDARDERHVVLDEQHRAARSLPGRGASSGPSASVSRCAIPDDGSSSKQHRRLVREHAREVDDPAGPGRQLRDELVAERAEAEKVDQLVDAVRDERARRSTPTAGRARSRPDPAPCTFRSSAHASVSRDRERREQLRVLERAAEPGARALGRREPGDVSAAEDDPSAVERRRTRRSRRRASSCRHRWVRSVRGSVPARRRTLTSSTATIAAEGRTPTLTCDGRGIVIRVCVAAASSRRRRSRLPRGRPNAGCRGACKSSAVDPLNRISPFSMKYACFATVSATLTDCSTSTTVVPCAWISVDDVQQLLDDQRRESERQLVDHQQLRLRDERLREREHLLLAAGQAPGLLVEALAEDREDLETRASSRASTYGLSLSYSHAAMSRFSLTVSVGKTDFPPGIRMIPSAAALLRLEMRDVLAVEEHRAGARMDETGYRLEQRRLPGAVRARAARRARPPAPRSRRRTAPACRRRRRRCFDTISSARVPSVARW